MERILANGKQSGEMKHRPKVSVIIAVYNREQYIARAVESVVNQRFTDWELVVVDDGSTDRTTEIVSSFDDERIRLIAKPHTRCWDTKNRGLEESRGEFIMYIDSDDYISPKFLERGMEAIETNPNFDYYYPEKLLVVEEDGTPTNRIWRYLDYSLSERKNLLKLFLETTIGGIPHTGALVRKAVFEAHGYFDGELENFGDTAWVVRNALNVRFRMVDQLQDYFKRSHEAQICKNMIPRLRTTLHLMEYVIENHSPSVHSPDYSDSELNLYNHYVSAFMRVANQFDAPELQEPFLQAARKYLMKIRELETA